MASTTALVGGVERGLGAGLVEPDAGAARRRARRSRPCRRSRRCPWRSSSFDTRCRARIRSARARPRGPGPGPGRPPARSVGTRTATISSIRSSRASSSASRASVLTRSPAGRTQLRRRRDLAADPRRGQRPGQPEPGRAGLIGHRHRPRQAAAASRAPPAASGTSRALNTSPVTASIAAATTDRACTSSPTLVRSRTPGPPTTVG